MLTFKNMKKYLISLSSPDHLRAGPVGPEQERSDVPRELETLVDDCVRAEGKLVRAQFARVRVARTSGSGKQNVRGNMEEGGGNNARVSLEMSCQDVFSLAKDKYSEMKF